MERKWLIWAGFHGFCAVAMGAFAAHALKSRLEPQSLSLVETGARYQIYHALALMGVAALGAKYRLSGWGFALGALLFSLSLYALAFGAPQFIGAVTPLGGLLLLGAWLNLIIASWSPS